MPAPPADGTLRVVPLTPDRFPDLERLFGPNGASCGCWCMWWRLASPQFRAGKGDGNRLALRRYVKAGHVPGLLAYEGATAVGWIAVEPRASYPRLARSRNLGPVDDAPVWSITCFYVHRAHRDRGVTRQLIEAAAAHARAAGAEILEAYPRVPSPTAVDASLYTGVPSTFRAMGFVEVARRVPSRPIMRLALRGPKGRGRAVRARPAGNRKQGRARGRAS